MLAKRIIPTLLCKGRALFKGVAFDSWRSIGHAAQAVRVHAARGVDELILLDITATAEGRGPDLDLVRELSESVFIPLTVGGGVRSCDDIDKLLRAGADKVAICTAAFDVPNLLEEASARFGSQAIVAVVDVDRGVVLNGGMPRMWTHPLGAAAWFEKRGAGEILLQFVERDGRMEGYDLDLIREISDHLSVPLVVSGGCGTPQHMHEALQVGADAVAAGAMFAFTDHTPRTCAQYLRQRGWEVRL